MSDKVLNDTIHATGAAAGDTALGKPAAQVRVAKPTVSQVLARLPVDATELQKDSAIRANFTIKPPVFSGDPDSLQIPGLGSGIITPQVVSVTYKDNFFSSNPWYHPEIPYRTQGIAGDPLPYRFRTDSYVTSLILLSFFLVALVLARSFRYLSVQVKDFFYTRQHENMFTPAADTQLRGKFFLLTQTCFELGVLFFDYTQNALPTVFNQMSPYVLLAADVVFFLVFYFLKLGLYKVVNWIFFDRRRNALWFEAYMLTIFAEGVILFPVTLLVAYFDLSFSSLLVIISVVLGLIELLRLYKCYNIFFRYRFGYIHAFLYFCAMEIIPLLVLWRVLIFGSKYLTINF